MPIGHMVLLLLLLLLLLLGLEEGIHASVASHEAVCDNIGVPRKQSVGHTRTFLQTKCLLFKLSGNI